MRRDPAMIPFVMALAVGLAVAAAPPAARAQSKAAAEAAFEQGQRLRDAGDLAGACEAFARSQELDPQYGTQYNLALCLEQLGKLASAYGEYVELAAKDTNKKRRATARDKAGALKGRLTYLMLVIEAPAPDLRVERDGEDVTLLAGVTTPVDPGRSTFTATAPGREPWSREVDLTAPGATVTVTVPPLAEPVVAEPEPVRAPEPVVGERPLPVEPAPAPGDPGRGRRLVGLSLAGAGVVAAGVGLVFGVQAAGLKSDAEDACGGRLDPCAGDVTRARDLIDDARGKATLSNVFVGAGLAAAVVGVVVWATAPAASAERRGVAVSPVVGAGGVGVALDGRF